MILSSLQSDVVENSIRNVYILGVGEGVIVGVGVFVCINVAVWVGIGVGGVVITGAHDDTRKMQSNSSFNRFILLPFSI
jgi:hypothetical protein